jgi:hypothetical protein
VESEHSVSLPHSAETLHCRSWGELPRLDPCEVPKKGIYHDVANQEDLVPRDPLGLKVPDPRLLGDEKKVADCVGQLPIYLFGHSHVEGAQPCFNVRHLNAHLLCRQRAGNGGVDIAHNDNEVGPIFKQHLLERDHYPCRLSHMGTRAHLKMPI